MEQKNRIKKNRKINNLKGKNKKDELLKKLLNHSSAEQTMRYIGLNEDEINEEYKNLGL